MLLNFLKLTNYVCAFVGVQPVVCGVFRWGEHAPLAWEIQTLQLQLCCEDGRCWQEVRGEFMCVFLWGEGILNWNFFLSGLFWFANRWQESRWCWAATAPAVSFWPGEEQGEMSHLPTKPCRPADRLGDGIAATRHAKKRTGTVWPCSPVPCN